MGVVCLSICLEMIEYLSTAFLGPCLKSQHCLRGGLNIFEHQRLQRLKRSSEPLWRVEVDICVERLSNARLKCEPKKRRSLRRLPVGPEEFGGHVIEDGGHCLRVLIGHHAEIQSLTKDNQVGSRQL